MSKRKLRPTKQEKKDVFFVPFNKIEKLVKLIEERESVSIMSNCRRNLQVMQSRKSVPGFTSFKETSPNVCYHNAIKHAILSHNWDKLHYLLLKWPMYTHAIGTCNTKSYDTYHRAILILLLNHPSARSQSLLLEYFDMVKSCHGEEDQKGFIKLLMMLPERVTTRTGVVRYRGTDLER